MTRLSLVIVLALASIATAQWDPHFTAGRTTIVHLFEWRWEDIARECEQWLGPMGYAGVQTSPVTEHIIVFDNDKQRPWYERYQTVSYKLINRSGNEEQFKDMVRRCNAAGVRIYVDVVFNHMTASGRSQGTGGTEYDSGAQSYPGVPYSNLDFNNGKCPTGSGEIENYQDVNQVRNCRLVGMNDLDHSKDFVRGKILEYLNKLISFGVAGFRVDACKHMWPGDLAQIFNGLSDLNTEFGFPGGARPFIVQEVIDQGGEPIKASEYFAYGRVTEFKGCNNIGNIMRKWEGQKLSFVKNWGEGWGFMPDGNAFVFVDNHDNQRGEAAGPAILSFHVSRLYKMAQTFFLAWPYGITRVMSSYYWERKMENGHDLNYWIGPPHDNDWNILPVTYNADNTCENGWICEHRWRQIYNMVGFRNLCQGTAVNNWWDNGSNQIAFSRGDKGFVAINNDDFPLQATIQTGLPAGQYCDLISGNLENGSCSGKVITVNGDSTVNLDITNASDDPVVAIHVGAKL